MVKGYGVWPGSLPAILSTAVAQCYALTSFRSVRVLDLDIVVSLQGAQPVTASISAVTVGMGEASEKCRLSSIGNKLRFGLTFDDHFNRVVPRVILYLPGRCIL